MVASVGRWLQGWGGGCKGGEVVASAQEGRGNSRNTKAVNNKVQDASESLLRLTLQNASIMHQIRSIESRR